MRMRNANVNPIVLSVAIAVALGASFIAGQGVPITQSAGSQANGVTNISYSNNGITCQLPASSPRYVSYLVPLVVQSPIFLAATNGSPYLFGDASNMTNRIQIIGGKVTSGPLQNFSVAGGTTIHLPPVADLSFYTYGPGTSCAGQPPPPKEFLMVNVPLEGGSFNLTDIQIIPIPGAHYPAVASGG
jgi:hypothetical protein